MKTRVVDHTIYLTIEHCDYESLGSHSLTGYVSKTALKHSMSKAEALVVEVEQTTLEQRQRNGGPEILIMPEYVPMCLIADVLDLSKTIQQVTVRSVPKHHP